MTQPTNLAGSAPVALRKLRYRLTTQLTRDRKSVSRCSLVCVLRTGKSVAASRLGQNQHSVQVGENPSFRTDGTGLSRVSASIARKQLYTARCENLATTAEIGGNDGTSSAVSEHAQDA